MGIRRHSRTSPRGTLHFKGPEIISKLIERSMNWVIYVAATARRERGRAKQALGWGHALIREDRSSL